MSNKTQFKNVLESPKKFIKLLKQFPEAIKRVSHYLLSHNFARNVLINFNKKKTPSQPINSKITNIIIEKTVVVGIILSAIGLYGYKRPSDFDLSATKIHEFLKNVASFFISPKGKINFLRLKYPKKQKLKEPPLRPPSIVLISNTAKSMGLELCDNNIPCGLDEKKYDKPKEPVYPTISPLKSLKNENTEQKTPNLALSETLKKNKLNHYKKPKIFQNRKKLHISPIFFKGTPKKNISVLLKDEFKRIMVDETSALPFLVSDNDILSRYRNVDLSFMKRHYKQMFDLYIFTIGFIFNMICVTLFVSYGDGRTNENLQTIQSEITNYFVELFNLQSDPDKELTTIYEIIHLSDKQPALVKFQKKNKFVTLDFFINAPSNTNKKLYELRVCETYNALKKLYTEELFDMSSRDKTTIFEPEIYKNYLLLLIYLIEYALSYSKNFIQINYDKKVCGVDM